MKKILFVTLLAYLLSACGQQENNDTVYQENHEGTIVKIEETDTEGNSYNGRYYLLVISDIQNINFLDKTEDELIKLAQEKDGAYYNVNSEVHEKLNLELGTQIVLYYNGQGDSDPPVRDAEKIEVIAK